MSDRDAPRDMRNPEELDSQGGQPASPDPSTPEIPAPPIPEAPLPPRPEVPAPSPQPPAEPVPEVPAAPAPEPSAPSPEAAPPASHAQSAQQAPPPPPPRVAPGEPSAYHAPAAAAAECPKSKVAAGLFAILFGSFGVHKFYLGYMPAGFIMLGVTVISFGTLSFIPAIIGVIEGILYLTKSDAQFCEDYVYCKKAWF